MIRHLAVVISGFVFSLLLSTSSFGELAERRLTAEEQLKNYRIKIENSVERNLDFGAGGGGTGSLARDIRAIARDFSKGISDPVDFLGWDKVQLPITYDELREYVLMMNGGEPAKVLVYDYATAIDFANKRLNRAGIDFVVAEQAPEAALVEAVRDYLAIVPRQKRSIADIKKLELFVLGNRSEKELIEKVNAEGVPAPEAAAKLIADFKAHEKSRTIFVALDDEEIEAANRQLQRKAPPTVFKRPDGSVISSVQWKLAKDPKISRQQVLPEHGATPAGDRKRYNRWVSARLPLMMGLAVFGATFPVSLANGLGEAVTYFPMIASWTALSASIGYASSPNSDGTRKSTVRALSVPALAMLAAAGITIPTATNNPEAVLALVPALVGGSTAAALEYQFTVFSSKWAQFWARGGIPGNVLVNVLYPTIVSAAMIATESATGIPISLNTKEFLVKTVFVGTLAFVGSFGLMQIRAARDQLQGEFSNFSRFRLETASCFWNGTGRIAALTAAALGVQYGVGELWGSSFGVGEAIGWGIQAAYFTALTAPMWAKSFFTRKSYDAATRANFEHSRYRSSGKIRKTWNLVSYSCHATLGALGNWYTFSRSPAPIPVTTK